MHVVVITNTFFSDNSVITNNGLQQDALNGFSCRAYMLKLSTPNHKTSKIPLLSLPAQEHPSNFCSCCLRAPIPCILGQSCPGERI